MNLNATIDLYFGGAGSGCDPAVAEANGTKCGRPAKGQGKGELANWEREGRSIGGHQNRFQATINGKKVVIEKHVDQTVPGKRWVVYVNGVRTAFTFPNSLAARKAINKDPDKYVGKAQPQQPQQGELFSPSELPPRPDLAELSDLELRISTLGAKRVEVLGGGMNGSYKVTLEDGTKGVWKPASEQAEEGKDPEVSIRIRNMIDDLRQHNSEALGWDVAKILGYQDIVPETVVRKLNGQVGSFQVWRQGEVGAKFTESLLARNLDQDQLERAAAFDFVLRMPDRHGKNFLVSETEGTFKLSLIDNGLLGYERRFSANEDGFIRVRPSAFLKILTRDDDYNSAIDRRKIPSGLKESWKANWDRVEAAMRNREITEDAITLSRQRLNAFMSATTWGDLFEGIETMAHGNRFPFGW